MAGSGLVFSPTGDRAAYVRPAQGAAATEQLVVRELATGAERPFAQEGLRIASPGFTSDGASLLFIGKTGAETATHVWSLTLGGMQATRLTTSDGLRADLVVAPSGGTAMWTVGRAPFAAGGRGGRAGGGGAAGAGRGGGAPPQFVTRDLASGAERNHGGALPSLAADGRTVAYLDRRPGENTIFVANLVAGGAPVAVKNTPLSFDAPVISPGGGRCSCSRPCSRTRRRSRSSCSR